MYRREGGAVGRVERYRREGRMERDSEACIKFKHVAVPFGAFETIFAVFCHFQETLKLL